MCIRDSITDEIIASAGEDKIISIWDSKGNLIKELKQHEARIRSLAVANHPQQTSSTKFLVSGSSDGMMVLWRMETVKLDKFDIVEIARNNTQARLTSISVIGLRESEKKKRKRNQEREADSEVQSDDEEEEKKEKAKEKRKGKKMQPKKKSNK
eukprot:TRINITY_DN6907_c0_g1_i2.p1 TRINITY_DN6907_c0_g1~~TRINITY_DN6907_c0_g1_i2.p1  ORF type:complete len:154 (-),score=56.85 TRINITY_DN6907_c0_g1_i2:22-483(-)